MRAVLAALRRWSRPVGVLLPVLGMLGWVLASSGAAAQPTPPPPPAPGPCVGQGCLTPPPVSPPPPSSGLPPSPEVSQRPDQWLSNLLTGWLWEFFADLAKEALEGVLHLLGQTVLATPQLARIPAMGQVWSSSQQIVVAVYALVIIAGGIVVMGYQTMQTRSSIKEILPRLVVGFLAANLSLFAGGKMIEIANALSRAVLGDDLGMDQAARIMTDTLVGNLPTINNDFTPFYVLFTVLALVVMMIAVILTYVVRMMATVVLLAIAPLVLMCHGLPQTEGIAFWWWKSFAGVLAIQIAQSVTLIAAVKLFYLPGGISLF